LADFEHSNNQNGAGGALGGAPTLAEEFGNQFAFEMFGGDKFKSVPRILAVNDPRRQFQRHTTSHGEFDGENFTHRQWFFDDCPKAILVEIYTGCDDPPALESDDNEAIGFKAW